MSVQMALLILTHMCVGQASKPHPGLLPARQVDTSAANSGLIARREQREVALEGTVSDNRIVPDRRQGKREESRSQAKLFAAAQSR